MESEERERLFEEFKRINNIQKSYELSLKRRDDLVKELDTLNKELDKRKKMYDRLIQMKDIDKILLVAKNAHIFSNSNGFYVYCGSFAGSRDDFYAVTDNDIIEFNDPLVTYSVYRPLEVSMEEPILVSVNKRDEFENTHPIIKPANKGYAGYCEFKSRFFAGVIKNGEEQTVEFVNKMVKKNKH